LEGIENNESEMHQTITYDASLRQSKY